MLVKIAWAGPLAGHVVAVADAVAAVVGGWWVVGAGGCCCCPPGSH